LLDQCERINRDNIVLKLASLPKSSIDEFLLERGLDPTSIADAKAALALVGAPVTPGGVVDYSFSKHGSPPTFGKGRFGDGSHPVFYSALEMETCEEDVRYRLKDAKSVVSFNRYFQFIACDFSGVIVDLRGKETDHPELVSETEDGYPFCQALAAQARNSGIDGFHARSARKAGGICTPTFSRPALTNPRFVDAPRVTI
jgi:hypothetical protein